MEALPLSTSDSENWVEQFNQSLLLQRERTQEFLAAQRERLQGLEAKLEEQLRRAADEVGHKRDETRQARNEIDLRAERVAREAENLESLKEELAARQAEWEEIQQRVAQQQETFVEQIQRQYGELDQRRQELQDQQSSVGEAQAQLESARREQRLQTQQLAELRKQLDARQSELDTRQTKLQQQQADTSSQRRRVARDLKAQRAAQVRELRQLQAEARHREAELSQKLEAAGRREAELADGPGDSTLRKELQNLQAERGALAERLAEAEKEAKRARQTASSGDGATEELRRRYDMAMDDLRELKAKNAELQEKLSQAPEAASQAAAGGALDWEAQKEKILAALESDSGEGGQQAAEEHLKIEHIVEKTDRVMAEKDREIEELKQLLEDQSANVGSVAVGAAALGEVLDNDQIIREQRESLENLQKEWQEKLRQAEIEISVERAKIARERTEIEEKLRMLEEQGGAAAAQPGTDGGAAKPARGRWLSRLGLTDQDNQADK